MKWSVLFPGKVKPKILLPAQAEYTRRLQAFGVEVVEYKDEKVASHDPEQVRQLEAERILQRVKESDYLVACDERGTSVTTEELVAAVEQVRMGSGPFSGRRRVVVVVGGALGLAPSIRKRADAVWSLSGLVMAGGIARLVLLEGLYRAFTVADGHPYHNG